MTTYWLGHGGSLLGLLTCFFFVSFIKVEVVPYFFIFQFLSQSWSTWLAHKIVTVIFYACRLYFCLSVSRYEGLCPYIKILQEKQYIKIKCSLLAWSARLAKGIMDDFSLPDKWRNIIFLDIRVAQILYLKWPNSTVTLMFKASPWS